MPGLGGAWRSLVAHLLWEQGVGGSNPLAPIAKLARPLREPCGCSSTVEPQPSKLVMGVRFPSPALAHPARSKAAAIGRKLSITVNPGSTGITPCSPSTPILQKNQVNAKARTKYFSGKKCASPTLLLILRTVK